MSAPLLAQSGDRPGNPELRLVIPTVDEVRTSIEGWRAGFSIPMPSNNHKLFLRQYDASARGGKRSTGAPKDLYHRYGMVWSAGICMAAHPASTLTIP
jgi:hypothetical protein